MGIKRCNRVWRGLWKRFDVARECSPEWRAILGQMHQHNLRWKELRRRSECREIAGEIAAQEDWGGEPAVEESYG